MAMPIPSLFTNSGGKIPSVTSGLDNLGGWIGLGGDVKLVKDSIIYHRTVEDRHNYINTTDSGRIKECDWACDIGWYEIKHHWHPFIPVATSHAEQESTSDSLYLWYTQMDDQLPYSFMENLDGYVFTRRTLAACKYDYHVIDSLIEVIISNCSTLEHVGQPNLFDISILNAVFETEEELQVVGAQAKRAVLERHGWVRWAFAAFPDLSDLPKKILREIENLPTKSFRSRGVFLMLHEEWPSASFKLWIKNDVPLYYPWGWPERLDHRYGRLNPKLIAPVAGQEGNRMIVDELKVDEDWKVAARTTLLYNNFLQLRHQTDHSPVRPAFEDGSSFFVIDFEGWGRRRLPPGENPAAYAKRYQYTIYEQANTTRKDVVFWHWRLHSQCEAPATSAADTVAGEMTIWEAFKFEYGPYKGRFFDRDTGLPTEFGLLREEPWKFPSSFYPPAKNLPHSSMDRPSIQLEYL